MKTEDKILLKVCGMRQAANMQEVAALEPDYMGFIFYRKSKRFVGDDFLFPKEFPSSIQRVGVFVNEPTQNILKLSHDHALDCIQLHGNELSDQCRAIKDEGLTVIKVIHVDESIDFNELKPYKRSVDYFMFDTRDVNFGGTGRPFSWSLLGKYDQEIPFFLSGGLSPETVSRVADLKDMNLHALDVNSRVEVEPGLKDIGLIKKVKAEMQKL